MLQERFPCRNQNPPKSTTVTRTGLPPSKSDTQRSEQAAAVLAEEPGEALTIIGELFEEGEAPLMILGALGAQLRRLAAAARLHKQGMRLDDAMDQAGIMKWPAARESTRKQMKHLGWGRMDKLYDWLVEADLGMKGGSPLPERVLLERLIVRLGRVRATG